MDHIERLVVGNRVDEDEAVDANGMFGVEDRILILQGGNGGGSEEMVRRTSRKKTYLTGSVDDVTVVVDPLVVDSLGEDTLDGGVVGLDEVVLNELDDERRFA